MPSGRKVQDARHCPESPWDLSSPNPLLTFAASFFCPWPAHKQKNRLAPVFFFRSNYVGNDLFRKVASKRSVCRNRIGGRGERAVGDAPGHILNQGPGAVGRDELVDAAGQAVAAPTRHPATVESDD